MKSEPQARILLVDDEPANIELLADIFGDDYEVLFATEGEKALEIALSTALDVILLDVVMPGLDGFEVCARLKAHRHTADIPVVFITGIGDMEAEARGLEMGAVDYVTKPINPPVVRMRTENQIELHRARSKLSKLAITDGLTGLANRRHFDEVLTHEYDRLSRAQAQLSLVLLDLDHFKTFNDSHGHIQGDNCLRAVAQVLDAATYRPADLAARYGGEEFACVLPDTGLSGALELAERIQQGISIYCVDRTADPMEGGITASLGVAATRCRPGKSPMNLVARADEQLYRAKAAGRNRICYADD